MTINYKVFAAGDTLSANDLLTYIENQTVIQVDNEAELTTLNTTYPSVRVAFAQDTDKMYVNNDGVWEAVVSGTSPSLTNLTLTGNLTVQGTTTTIDSATIAIKDKFIFEGATADAHETTLQVAEPTADRTITLPDATGTVALTSGLYALPSQTGNSGKYLKTDGTNETWSIDATSDLITTAGDIVYGTAADTMARLGIGTANQVLRVNSGATAPEWATPASGGGMTLLSTTNLSGTTTTISGISGSYINLFFQIRNADLSAADRITVNINGAAMDCISMCSTNIISTHSNRWGSNAAQSAANQCIAGYITNYAGSTSGETSLLMHGGSANTGNTSAFLSVGLFTGSAPITSIGITTVNGTATFTDGSVLLYGVK